MPVQMVRGETEREREISKQGSWIFWVFKLATFTEPGSSCKWPHWDTAFCYYAFPQFNYNIPYLIIINSSVITSS